MEISGLVSSRPAVFFPGTAIAIAVLFLEGVALWPVIYLASLLGNFLRGGDPAFLLFMPIAHALTAAAGACLLKKLRVDPLFRSMRDALLLILIAAFVSAIVPSLGTAAYVLNNFVLDMEIAPRPWSTWYVGTLTSVLILTPFVMRWFAKPRFWRRWSEVAETVGAFAFLLVIEYFLFYTHDTSIANISLVYVLLLPLFWIALRLRPRFITLAMVLTAAMAMGGLFWGEAVPPPEKYSDRLFQIELFLSILTIIFLILASVEEARRVTANLMRSQVAMLQNAVARITSESKAKNNFIAILAHELRNPLAPVVSGIELLKAKGSAASKEEADMVALMDDRMQTVRHLLDDLLDVSRISENKIRLQRQVIDIALPLRRAISSTTPYYRERHQTLSISYAKDALYVNGDPLRLEQVFSNLFTNASKYSHPGERIAVAVKAESDRVSVEVSDRGVGIPPELIDRIFEPFHQAELGERTTKGLGIGLALVKSFVEMHDGSVRAESAGAGKGSTFTVTLPRVSPVQEPLTATPEKKTEPHQEVSGDMRILVVDDNDAAAWGVGKLLELRGAKVSYAYDGIQAIEKAQQGFFDVILLDIGLPDQDGYFVATEIRKNGYDGVLIALSGYSLEQNVERSREAGFDHYLVKPTSLSDLIQAIPGLR